MFPVVCLKNAGEVMTSSFQIENWAPNLAGKAPGLLIRVVGMKDWVEWALKRPKQGEERECVSTNKSFEVSGYREVAQQRNSLSLPSWNIAEMHVLLIPCSLYFRVQSCSNFQPDLPASPPIPPCQCAFCSLPPVLLPNATITERYSWS